MMLFYIKLHNNIVQVDWRNNCNNKFLIVFVFSHCKKKMQTCLHALVEYTHTHTHTPVSFLTVHFKIDDVCLLIFLMWLPVVRLKISRKQHKKYSSEIVSHACFPLWELCSEHPAHWRDRGQFHGWPNKRA